MELDVKKIGNRTFVFTLGEHEVQVRGEDYEAVKDRALELLGIETGKQLIARSDDAVVIDVPKFETGAKAATPSTKKKG